MKSVVVIQARMSSRRLPGKTLVPIAGKPMLQHTVERVRRAGAGCVVATSTDESDSPVAEFCGKISVPCHRGDLENVASRFADVIRETNADCCVRISGDSPLIDPALITRVIRLFEETPGCDLATNVLERTYPPGMSVEAFSGKTFLRIYPELTDKGDREHVTTFFYKNAARFKIADFKNPVNLRHIRLVVDTPEDLASVSAIMNAMGKAGGDCSLDEIIKVRENCLRLKT